MRDRKAELQKLREELTSTRIELDDAKNATAVTRRQSVNATERASKVEREMADKDATITRLTSSRADIEHELQMAREQGYKVANAVDAMQRKVDALEQSANTMREQKITLESTNATMLQERQAATAEHRRLKEAVRAAEERAETAKNELQRQQQHAEDRLAAQLKALGDAERIALKHGNALDLAGTRIDSLSREVDSLKRELATEHGKLEERSAETRNAYGQLTAARNAEASTVMAMEALRGSVETRHAQLSEWHTELDQRRAQVIAEEQRVITARAEAEHRINLAQMRETANEARRQGLEASNGAMLQIQESTHQMHQNAVAQGGKAARLYEQTMTSGTQQHASQMQLVVSGANGMMSACAEFLKRAERRFQQLCEETPARQGAGQPTHQISNRAIAEYEQWMANASEQYKATDGPKCAEALGNCAEALHVEGRAKSVAREQGVNIPDDELKQFNRRATTLVERMEQLMQAAANAPNVQQMLSAFNIKAPKFAGGLLTSGLPPKEIISMDDDDDFEPAAQRLQAQSLPERFSAALTH
jgi:hypothetical protein